jgi:hypothetical protein
VMIQVSEREAHQLPVTIGRLNAVRVQWPLLEWFLMTNEPVGSGEESL